MLITDFFFLIFEDDSANVNYYRYYYCIWKAVLLNLCRYYCESCEQAICRECTMTSHSTERHKYTQLTDTIDKQTQTISQLADKLKRKVPVVTQSTKDVEEVTCRLEARAEVAKSEIQKCFPRILKALQDREKAMMAEVESMVQRKSKVLGMQQERLENELKRLTTTCNFTGKL